MGKRIIVCGSRGWTDRQRIANRLFDLPGDTTIVHGGAKGVDRIAGQEAQKLGLAIIEYLPDWNLYGKRAGLVRNEIMACEGADLCIAFWDGHSTGTAHMMEMASKYKIPREIIS